MNMEYKNEVKFYLGIQILKMNEFKDKWLIIDNYYKELDNLVIAYQKWDNKDKSLLDSVNDYIENNKEFILYYLKYCFVNKGEWK